MEKDFRGSQLQKTLGDKRFFLARDRFGRGVTYLTDLMEGTLVLADLTSRGVVFTAFGLDVKVYVGEEIDCGDLKGAAEKIISAYGEFLESYSDGSEDAFFKVLDPIEPVLIGCAGEYNQESSGVKNSNIEEDFFNASSKSRLDFEESFLSEDLFHRFAKGR